MRLENRSKNLKLSTEKKINNEKTKAVNEIYPKDLKLESQKERRQRMRYVANRLEGGLRDSHLLVFTPFCDLKPPCWTASLL